MIGKALVVGGVGLGRDSKALVAYGVGNAVPGGGETLVVGVILVKAVIVVVLVARYG